MTLIRLLSIGLQQPIAGRGWLLVAASIIGTGSLHSPAWGQVVLPPSYASTSGDTASDYAVSTGARTYQMQIASSQVGLSAGMVITGLTFRLTNSSPSSGSGASSFTNWDVRLAQAANPIGNMVNTFAANMVNPQLVRSGALSLAAGDFSGGATSPDVNAFGTVIDFTTPYTYQGGDLVILISHTAGSGSVGFLDSLSLGTSGYGSQYRAVQGTSYNATSGAIAPLTIMQLTTASVPEPSTLAMASLVASIVAVAGLRKRPVRA